MRRALQLLALFLALPRLLSCQRGPEPGPLVSQVGRPDRKQGDKKHDDDDGTERART